MAYLRQMRAEWMARLLASTDLSIAKAARAVGWRNQLHAGQCFHAAYISLRPSSRLTVPGGFDVSIWAACAAPRARENMWRPASDVGLPWC